MRLHWIVASLCMIFLSAVLVRAEDKPAADSSADKRAAADAKPEKKQSVRLVKPWIDMSSLSDEQKEKIKTIHAKANDEVKAIHEKEHAEIVALLSDDQKNELKSLEENMAAATKTKAAEKKESAAASSGDAAPASEKKDASADSKVTDKKDADAAK
jgi:Spy/CpxP family protein refolding chaperone